MKRLGLLLLSVSFISSASASALDPAALLASYNLITAGNATTNGDIEGAMLVGGNFTGAAGTANLFNNTARLPSDKTSYIYGNNSSGINVDNGGRLYIGGNNNGPVNLNAKGSIQVAGNNAGNINGSGAPGFIAVGGSNSGSINFNGAANLMGNSTAIVPVASLSDVVSTLTSYSVTLAAKTANGTTSKVGNIAKFEYAGAGPAIFSLTANDLTTLATNANMDFLVPAADTPVVVNVDLQGASWTAPSSGHFVSGSPLQNVLFNFYNGSGSTLNFSTLWEASILAMGSEVINGTPIEGSVAAASFTGHGELHNYPLQHPPGDGGNENPPPAIPEPAPLGMMFGALLVLAGMLRRKAIRA